MRKIIGAAFVSLDGVMQAPGGPSEDPTGGFRYGGWTPAVCDEEIGRGNRQAVRRPITTCCSAAAPTTSSPLTGPYAGRSDRTSAIRSTPAPNMSLTQRRPAAGLGEQRRVRRHRRRVAAIKQGEGPRLDHPGQQHALSAAARGRPDRRADADDLPGRARQGQAPVRRWHPPRTLKMADQPSRHRPRQYHRHL